MKISYMQYRTKEINYFYDYFFVLTLNNLNPKDCSNFDLEHFTWTYIWRKKQRCSKSSLK